MFHLAKKSIAYLICAAALAMVGCAQMKAIGINLAACVIGQVPSAVAGIIPDVETVLGGEQVDWESQLSAIGVRSGLDALACAIKSIVGVLSAKHASLDPTALQKIARGQAYLSAHGIK